MVGFLGRFTALNACQKTLFLQKNQVEQAKKTGALEITVKSDKTGVFFTGPPGVFF